MPMRNVFGRCRGAGSAPRSETGVVREIPENVVALSLVQEEPENMGAWEVIRTPLQALIGDLPLQVIARRRSSSPAEGSAARHAQNQDRLIAQVWTVAAARTSPARKGSKR